MNPERPEETSMVMVNYCLHQHYYEHDRAIYNFLDLLGDYGGLQAVAISFICYFISPWVQHNYLIKAIEKLYMGSTKDDNLFSKIKDKKI